MNAQIEAIKKAIVGTVVYERNLDEKDLIDAIYYDKDQDYTVIGTSDYHDGALSELIYNMRNDQRFDISRLLAKNDQDAGPGNALFEQAEILLSSITPKP